MGPLRDRSLDFIRLTAVGLIVVLHAWGAAVQYGEPGSAETLVSTFLASYCTNFALPSLFLVSGYLAFRNFSLPAWPQKIVRRLRRLCVPYVCWNVVFVLFYLSCFHFFPRVGARVEEFGLTTWRGCLAKILSPCEQPIDVPLWYVRAIFVFMLAAPVLFPILRNRRLRWLGLAVAVGWCVAVDELKFPCGVPGYPPLSFLAFYVGGLLCVSNISPTAFFRPALWLVPAIVGLALDLCDLLELGSPVSLVTRSLLKVPLFFCLCGRLFVRRPSLASLIPSSSVLFFAFAGHFLFCSVWVHAIGPLLGSLATGRLTLLFFLFLGPGLAVTLGVHRLGMRLMPRTLRLFDGTL